MNTFSHSALSLEKISFSYCMSFAYNSAASSALVGFCAVSSAILESEPADSLALPPGAEHATRHKANTGTIKMTALLNENDRFFS